MHMMRTRGPSTWSVVALSLVGLTRVAHGVPIKGSELDDMTRAVLDICTADTAAYSFVGGGSDVGEQAMLDGTQKTAPMARFLDPARTCLHATPEKAQGFRIAPVQEVQELPLGVFSAASSSVIGCGGVAYQGSIAVTERNGVPALQCPGCSGSTYVLSDWRDTLRLLLAGMPHGAGADINLQDCNSDLRHSLVSDFEKVFQGTCSGSSCTELEHVYRPPDDFAAMAELLDVLDLPPITAEPFCNGNELHDGDPVRRICGASDSLCGAEGTLGLVQPIHVTEGAAPAVLYPAEPCAPGNFARLPAMNVRLGHPIAAAICPDGVGPFFGQCVVPLDSAGSPACRQTDALNLSPFAAARRVCTTDGEPQKICTTGPSFCTGSGTPCTTPNDCAIGASCKRPSCTHDGECPNGSECVVESCTNTQRVCTDSPGRFCQINPASGISTCPSGLLSSCVISNVCTNSATTLCTTDSQCGAGKCRPPTRCTDFADPSSSCVVRRPDGRVYNRRAYTAAGTFLSSGGIQTSNAAFRGGVACDETNSGTQIACLSGERACTLGLLDASTVLPSEVELLSVNGVLPTDTANYPLSSQKEEGPFYLNMMTGEESLSVLSPEGQTTFFCFGNANIVRSAATSVGLTPLGPSESIQCVDFDETQCPAPAFPLNSDACKTSANQCPNFVDHSFTVIPSAALVGRSIPVAIAISDSDTSVDDELDVLLTEESPGEFALVQHLQGTLGLDDNNDSAYLFAYVGKYRCTEVGTHTLRLRAWDGDARPECALQQNFQRPAFNVTCLQSPCIDCEDLAPCEMLTDACDTDACEEVLFCARDTRCAQDDFEYCYCGASGDCLTAPQGPCKAEIEHALGQTDPALVFPLLSQAGNVAGDAAGVLECDRAHCPTQCSLAP